jgi:hypothetical protein
MWLHAAQAARLCSNRMEVGKEDNMEDGTDGGIDRRR